MQQDPFVSAFPGASTAGANRSTSDLADALPDVDPGLLAKARPPEEVRVAATQAELVPLSHAAQHLRRFRVGLSFPGEKRDFVQAVAGELAGRIGKEHILYDEYLAAELAQPDMDLYLGRLYREDTDLLVPFYCREYEKKKWCRLEWRQMRDILVNVEPARIMPFRFDEATIPGVLSIDGYVEIGAKPPSQIAALILERLSGEHVVPPPPRAWWRGAAWGGAGAAVMWFLAVIVALSRGRPFEWIAAAGLCVLLSAVGGAVGAFAEKKLKHRPHIGFVAGVAVVALLWILFGIL